MSELVDKGRSNFCFNLEKVTYLNSSGVSIFIHALAETEAIKGKVYMVVPESHVRKVVELAGLDKLITTYSSMKEFERSCSK